MAPALHLASADAYRDERTPRKSADEHASPYHPVPRDFAWPGEDAHSQAVIPGDYSHLLRNFWN